MLNDCDLCVISNVNAINNWIQKVRVQFDIPNENNNKTQLNRDTNRTINESQKEKWY